MPNSTKLHTEEQISLSSVGEFIPLKSIKKKQKKPTVKVNIYAILKFFVITAFILLILNLVVIMSYKMHFKFPDKFNFDREDSVPTYFSALILLISASILGLIAFLKRKEKDSFAIHWMTMSLIFLGLSIDESVSFHEILTEPFRSNLQLSGFLRFSWVIPVGIFVIFFCISYLKFFLALPKKMKVMFFVSGAVYVFGALGLEMIGGSIYKGDGSLDVTEQSLTYMLVTTTEETLEMTGILLFIYTLLQYIKAYNPKIKLSVN